MAKKSVREQIQKHHEYFAEAVDGLSVTDLKQEILRYAKETETTQAALNQLNEEGGALYLAKAAVAEIAGPYKDAQKAIKLKMSYLSQLVEEKGGDLP